MSKAPDRRNPLFSAPSCPPRINALRPSRLQGVLVGEWWKDRLDCRQWGAHFPHVAGIAGQSGVGSQSVVLSGGYEDDKDEGEWFLYTGSGGRDLSGNKRTSKVRQGGLHGHVVLSISPPLCGYGFHVSEPFFSPCLQIQSFDQEFENMNKALKLSCIKGLPVRVVRSFKASAMYPPLAQGKSAKPRRLHGV